MRSAGLALTTALVCACLAPVSPAQEWTRFRGPNGSGIGQDGKVPVRWTDKDYNWKIELPGTGHSSPVIWGDRVFVTCTRKETAQQIVLAINAADGKVRWRHEFAGEPLKINKDNSYASSTPAVDADALYVAWSTSQHYTLAAVSHEGKELWQCDLGPYKSQHGSSTSPIVVGDLVVLSNDQDGPESFLVGVDRKTGKVAWKSPRTSGRTSGCTPVVFQPTEGKPQLVFTSTMHGFTGHDPATGAVLWQLPKAFPLRCIGSPVVAGDLLVATCGEGPGGKHLVAVRPGTGGQAEQAYHLTTMLPYVPTPLVLGELMFCWSDTGTVTCAKAATGETVWQEKVGGDYYSSPVCVNGRIYNVSKKGQVVVLAASEKYELLARNELGETCFSTPAIAGGRMYVRTFSHLISVGGK